MPRLPAPLDVQRKAAHHEHNGSRDFRGFLVYEPGRVAKGPAESVAGHEPHAHLVGDKGDGLAARAESGEKAARQSEQRGFVTAFFKAERRPEGKAVEKQRVPEGSGFRHPYFRGVPQGMLRRLKGFPAFAAFGPVAGYAPVHFNVAATVRRCDIYARGSFFFHPRLRKGAFTAAAPAAAQQHAAPYSPLEAEESFALMSERALAQARNPGALFGPRR